MSAIATDHIEELLVLIVRFTRARRRVLIGNLRGMNREGFVPQDLAVQEFSEQLHAAITEHRTHRRLILRDHPHLQFGSQGCLHLVADTDPRAKELLDLDRGLYLRYQRQRLVENALNEEVAWRMLTGYAGRVVGLPTRRITPTPCCRPQGRAALNDDVIDF